MFGQKFPKAFPVGVSRPCNSNHSINRFHAGRIVLAVPPAQRGAGGLNVLGQGRPPDSYGVAAAADGGGAAAAGGVACTGELHGYRVD